MLCERTYGPTLWPPYIADRAGCLSGGGLGGDLELSSRCASRKCPTGGNNGQSSTVDVLTQCNQMVVRTQQARGAGSPFRARFRPFRRHNVRLEAKCDASYPLVIGRSFARKCADSRDGNARSVLGVRCSKAI